MATGPDLLDPRQREAAAILLSAINLPAEASAFSRALLRAAAVCPGITIEKLAIGRRVECLRRARTLIDAMLAEIA